MASRKRSTRPFGKSKEDRLSNLPDALLHHILSFLTTQEVVQTCVLSKRWRYLWTCVPFLDFDLKAFQSVERGLWDKMVPFTNFINQVLLRHNCSRIVKFRCDPSGYAMQHDLLESWIYYALQRGVQELYLNIFCHSTPGPVVLPHCFTGFKSLTKLTLIAYYHSIVLPKSFVLPSLKSLHLAGDFDVDGDLISSCQNLEFLKIDNIQNVNIHALNLRFLEFSYKNRGCACIPHIAKVKLFAPKLTNFKLKSFTSILFSAENLASLDEVNINVHPSFHGYYGSTDEFKQELCSCMIRMLNEFHNTKSMILSSTTIEVLSLNPAALSAYPSAFPNLKYLKLEMDRWCKVIKIPACLLTYFCNDATSLEVIMFEGMAIKAEKLFEGSSFRQHQHAVSLYVLRNSYGPCNIRL